MLHCLLHNREQLNFHYADGKIVVVRMSPAGGNVQYVKIYDLPPEVPDSDLALVLGKYGEVKRVVREKFPADLGLDMYTGVRGVYMDVRKEIPNSLHFRNRKGNIFYQGNKNLCFLCKMEGHRMNSCPKRKDRKQPVQQKEGNQRNEGQTSTSTYAGVVTGVALSITNDSQETEEAVEVLQEEVLEMDVTSPETEKTNEEETTDARKQEPPVFKCRNDAYYYYKFGIVDYTEKERIKDEEEAKRRAMEQEKRLEELQELRRRQKAEAKLKSPPRKSMKNS